LLRLKHTHNDLGDRKPDPPCHSTGRAGSAVAPLWAALIALLNQQRGSNIGFANLALYQNAENGFHDITQGNNGSYSAGPGWDPCTGLGSPNGNQLSQIFAATTTGAAQAVPVAASKPAHAGD
jgi:kumamolisin